MRTLVNLGSRIANAITDNEFYTWPPVCIGVFCQPERPVSNLVTQTDPGNREDKNVFSSCKATKED